MANSQYTNARVKIRKNNNVLDNLCCYRRTDLESENITHITMPWIQCVCVYI